MSEPSDPLQLRTRDYRVVQWATGNIGTRSLLSLIHISEPTRPY